MNNLLPFHLAIPAHDLKQALHFYRDILGCTTGRVAEKWIDFNFFGHQLSVHLRPNEILLAQNNTVDGKNIPVRHFGVVLPWDDWHTLTDRIRNHVTFIVEPYIRFKGEVGEQATMFFPDPSGNALEFKSFKDIGQLFAA